MAPRADSTALNVQPRQRRIVYDGLAASPDGRSVKELMTDFDIPEQDLRETLRKLDQAGLAQRVKGVWKAISIEDADEPAEVDDSGNGSQES